MSNRSLFFRGLLFAALGVFCGTASGGNISFNLALTGTQLTLTNVGDSAAFFPRALTMLADGSWRPLSPSAGQDHLTQLDPGERLELLWPDARPLEKLSAVERLRPTMLRFFDQAGVGFGQISFFTTPPPATATLRADYVGGRLRLEPPNADAIRVTWVLWPQEAGIAAIRKAFKRDIDQPPARRIDWRNNSKIPSLFTGDAQPSAILIHETAQGFQLQKVAAGWRGGKQQRSPWLDAGREFYALAALLAVLAVLATVWPWWRRRRGAARA